LRFLRIFAPVSEGEGPTALLLTLNVFLLLAAYYLLKVAREPLVLAAGGAEVKAYAAAGQSFLLVLVVRAYDALTRRYGRVRLVTATILFFASHLVIFAVLGRAGIKIGIPFYLWVGVFNVTLIAQFWGFAADVYTPEQGKRLFAIVGVGSSVGALFGAKIAKWLFTPAGPFGLMLLAAVVIILCLLLMRMVDARERGRPTFGTTIPPDAPLGGKSGFALVLEDRYLVLAALLALVLNGVNTTGEYLLDRTLLASLVGGHEPIDQSIGHFKAEFFFWVNLAAVFLQLFVVSRVFRRVGVRGALLVLPVVALAGYTMLAIRPVLTLFAPVKVAENSLDYSLQNTARQALFLPVERSAKYKAKAVIDGLLVRVGDVLSALLVFVGTHIGLSLHGFALVNVALAAAWLALVVALGAEYQRRAAGQASATTQEGSTA
jgi:AAA family ATP:ADP antiporter